MYSYIKNSGFSVSQGRACKEVGEDFNDLRKSELKWVQRPYMPSLRTLVKTGEGVAKGGSDRCDGFDIRISLETHL